MRAGLPSLTVHVRWVRHLWVVSTSQEGVHLDRALRWDQQRRIQLGLLYGTDRLHGQNLHGELKQRLCLVILTSVLFTASDTHCNINDF